MAKEMLIIFVYDTEMVQNEEDDPSKAILYFHPTWVSDQQKVALCGQLMGTIHCLKTMFSTPKIVALQSGKFYVIENGRYLLAIGTDRNIGDWLLEHRAKTLFSLINFFHKDFQALSEIYPNRESFSAKLYHLFETYIKMLVFGSNLFSHIPTSTLPKSASNVFMEAIQLLQCCQNSNHTLGGTLLYHNKVIATQLSPQLTKSLVLSDPYRIKCPAEIEQVDFDLPIGVQLLQVYISQSEYYSLLDTSVRNRTIFEYLKNKSIKKQNPCNKPANQDVIISQMKRDQSLIFTAVPEEGGDSSEAFVPAKKVRPKFLNLKPFDTSIEEKQPITPYNSNQLPKSVCSTPLTELKKFLHQNPLSICLSKNSKNIVENNQSDLEMTKENKLDCFLPINSNNSFFEYKKNYLSTSNLNSIINDTQTVFLTKSKFKTITDPTFPVFKPDGTIISFNLYNFYISKGITDKNISKDELMNNFKNFDACFENLPKQDLKNSDSENSVQLSQKQFDKKLIKEKRKSLTLPIKSLNMDQTSTSDTNNGINLRRNSAGVQLTPLMAKLSMLAFDEKSSGFGSRESTPAAEYRGMTPIIAPSFSIQKSAAKKLQDKDQDDLQKCILFVCGQQDVVLLFLVQKDCCKSSETINKLWEICTEELGKLEKQLHYCLEAQPGGSGHETEPYSYLVLNSDWDMVQRGGPWATSEQSSLSSVHRDFSDFNNITEILIRGFDNIVYGYHSGQNEIFYHESIAAGCGLPPPADPMGLVQLKAKKRLERDHAIILL